ncbi:MAG TPA: DUF255 domain-containing protein [Opitutaceae bacterium]|nr:DUF255 domain-containing protein [Opitutaceae bacterium]
MCHSLFAFRCGARAVVRRLGVLAALWLAGSAPGALAADAAPGWLATSPSAFVRSYTTTRVEWMPWGDAAFERARRENKPLFVEVGAFGNQLSRAMARQTFGGGAATDLLNRSFVCVLVDRDERPDVAALLITYVHRVKQLDGWPLNVWLTPDLRPYDGATYLPPVQEWGKPAFIKIAQSAQDEWGSPATIRSLAAEAMAMIAPNLPPVSPAAPDKIATQLTASADAWLGFADQQHGGFGDPPRYPEPELLRFLLQRSGPDREFALKTLRLLANSALRDPLDGGFFHSADDKLWHIPTPQKTLYDQGRIALAYLDAAAVRDDAVFVAAARGILDFTLSRLMQPDATFDAMRDGTDEDYTGHYAWTAAEIEKVLGPEAAAFERAHGVEKNGNIPADFDPNGWLKGKNFLRSTLPADPADAAAAAKLLAIRDRRPALPRDGRATAAAEGLVIAALARAGEQLHEARYTAAATAAFDALKTHFGLTAAGDLRHQHDSELEASPADDAAVALACRALARATHREELAGIASALLKRSAEGYFNPKTGRYFATALPLPTGFFVRPLATVDVVSPEPLALLAGPDDATRTALTAALASSVENGPTTPAGDVLLALATSR